VADGCATAEDAALMAALAGKSSNYISQAVDVCLQGLQHWEQGGTPVRQWQEPAFCALKWLIHVSSTCHGIIAWCRLCVQLSSTHAFAVGHLDMA
jgi:hypothetical protein